MVIDTKAKDCCDNEIAFVKADSEQLTASAELNFEEHSTLLLALLVSIQWEVPTLERTPTPYLNYKPPLIVCDLPVRLQTFLC